MVLTITGSDNSGWSGLQLDFKTIAEMGGRPLTAATCIVMQDEHTLQEVYDFPTEVIRKQVRNVITDFHPKAVKVGLVRSADAVRCVRNEVVGCRRIVVAPGIVSSTGIQLIDGDTIDAIRRYLIPEATLVVLRCVEAEKILDTRIDTDEDMLTAARQLTAMGAQYVLLRGGKHAPGRITALLYAEGTDTVTPVSDFFSSYNIEGWRQHGIGGALSAAITTRLGMGDDVPTAIRTAHEYMHSRVVYAVKDDGQNQRPADIYNQLMSLVAKHYAEAHDVAYYAGRLAITTRYLSQVTEKTVGKSPKQVIADYLMNEARQLLLCSRLTVQEISIRLGFSSQAAFNTFFRKQEHCTPSEFRGL